MRVVLDFLTSFFRSACRGFGLSATARAGFLLLALVVGHSHPVEAQVFAGGGIVLGADSTATQLQFADRAPCAAANALIEGGMFLSRYLGVGGEWVHCADINHSVGGRVFGSATEAEDVITASLRLRFRLSSRVSTEAFGGAGVIFSDVTQVTGTLVVPEGLTITFHETGTELALQGGMNLLFDLLPHLAVGPSLRVYNLRRPAPLQTASEWTTAAPGLLIRLSW